MTGARAAVLMGVVVVAACTTPGSLQGEDSPSDAPLRVLARSGDAASAVSENGVPRLVVRRERGIGRATLEVARAAWPAELEVDLDGFGNLEHFVACNEERCFETSLRLAPRARVRDGEGERWSDDVEMPVEVREGSIRVGVPAGAVAAGSPRLDLRWVDEFR